MNYVMKPLVYLRDRILGLVFALLIASVWGSLKLGIGYLKLRLPLKALLWILIVTLVAIVFSGEQVVHIDRGTLVSVLGLQAAFAGYMLAITRDDHEERMRPIMMRIFTLTQPDESLNEWTNFTLQFPQRLATYVLAADLVACPFVLLESQFVQIWVTVVAFINIIPIVISVVFNRVELVEKWLVNLVGNVSKFLKRHKELIVLMGVFILALLWMKPPKQKVDGDGT